MNILVASIQLPWPLDSGGKVALYSCLECLREDHHFTLVCPARSEIDLRDALALQAQLPEITVRAVDCRRQEELDKASEDLVQRSFRSATRRYSNWKNAKNRNAKQTDEQIYIYPFDPLPEVFINAVAEELSNGPDLIQVEFAEMLSLGAWLPKETPRIFIHHQLHFVYAKRFAAARKRTGFFEYLQSVMQTQERLYLQKFDGVVVFSDDDKRALLDWLPDEKVHVSPFPIAGAIAISGDQGEVSFTCIGSESHFPNRDALEWLTAEVWPEIVKQRPGSKLKVIGPWSEASKNRFSMPGIEFMGYVPDLEKALNGNILLVPLRVGSGIRVKLLDAMARGIPAVSTSIGCEGIPASDGVDILIRDGGLEFAAAAIQLLDHPDLRARLAIAAKDLVARLYSPEQVRQRRNEIYRIVCRQAAGRSQAKA